MRYTVEPATGPLRATLRVPGDKSISHRAVLFAAMAEGTSHAFGVLDSADVRRSIGAVRALGATVAEETTRPGELALTVTGWGSGGPGSPDSPIDAGNSGTTARLLIGMLAGWPGLEVTIIGDESLLTRPMDRIIEPLTLMGASIEADEGRLPIRIHGAALHGGSLEIPVASAQVKSALLLAGLRCAGTVEVYEPAQSRDHTELMLPAFGIDVQVNRPRHASRVTGPAQPVAADVTVPGDPSSAAFWLAAAALVPGSDVTVTGVSLNETRIGFIRAIERMGCSSETKPTGSAGMELVGDVRVLTPAIGPVLVAPRTVPSLIDELPMLAVVAAHSSGVSRFEGIAELRVKESDRLAAIADGLTSLGIKVRDGDDWLEVHGNAGAPFATAELDSLGDHRLAMAWAIAGLAASGPLVIDGFEAVDVSYPTFAVDLDLLRAGS